MKRFENDPQKVVKIMTAVPLQYQNDSKSNSVCYNNNIIVLAN